MSEHVSRAKIDDIAARIVRLLSLTTRPLRPGELRAALGMRSAECDEPLRWLDRNGYIVRSPLSTASRESRDGAMAWALGGRGLLWISHEQGGALPASDAGTPTAH
jgi:hypothetical protein